MYGTLKIAPGQPLAMAFQNIDLFEFIRVTRYRICTHVGTSRLAETDSDRANDTTDIGVPFLICNETLACQRSMLAFGK